MADLIADRIRAERAASTAFAIAITEAHTLDSAPFAAGVVSAFARAVERNGEVVFARPPTWPVFCVSPRGEA